MSNEDYNPKSIDSKLASIEQKLDELIERRRDHELRISALEKFQWKAVGVIAAVMFVLNYFQK